jgi:hypothetical protein
MKKFLFIFFAIALSLPLYAQESLTSDDDPLTEYQSDRTEEIVSESEESADLLSESEDQPKKPFNFARQKFEFGIDVGAGIDNDLLKIGDIFKKEIVIDLNKLYGDVSNTGLNINLDVGAGLFLNVKNIEITESLWDFGFFLGVDGRVNLNVPRSIFTLVSKGNIDQHYFEGLISAAGSVFANAGLSGSAKFGKLRVGLKPAVYAPLLFIPRSGISYTLDTEESIFFSTSGDIKIYSPFVGNGELKFGVDLSANGEYALFPFLDVGGSLSSIPLVPAALENGMMYSLKMDEPFTVTTDDLLNGDVDGLPEFKIDDGKPFTEKVNVFRPLRFDIYARYKPFNSELLVIRPNIGFSVDINNKEGYFNAGLEAQLNLFNNLLMLNLGTHYTDAVWMHRLGLALNLRAFELDLSGALRSESFAGSFQAQGFNLNLGLRFGW